jgi:precorrin-2/cobalt-factor-2 C20-methyltransferase
MSCFIGTLYGVSVGPGDPELMTIKAKKTLERCHVLAVPVTHKDSSLALDIVSKAMDISNKDILPLLFPMTTDEAYLSFNYESHATCLAKILLNGMDVAFACLGDVSVFSTFAYISELLKERGYPVVMIPGVTSFCASACALGISLTLANTPLSIIPAGFEALDEALKLPGTKVLMKSASQFSRVRQAILSSGQTAYAAVNCGLNSESLYPSLADIPDAPGYFTTIIVKEQP